MGAADAGVQKMAQQARVIGLLQRCRRSVAWDDADWQQDVEEAMASDAALVVDIDAEIARLQSTG